MIVPTNTNMGAMKRGGRGTTPPATFKAAAVTAKSITPPKAAMPKPSMKRPRKASLAGSTTKY